MFTVFEGHNLNTILYGKLGYLGAISFFLRCSKISTSVKIFYFLLYLANCFTAVGSQTIWAVIEKIRVAVKFSLLTLTFLIMHRSLF